MMITGFFFATCIYSLSYNNVADLNVNLLNAQDIIQIYDPALKTTVLFCHMHLLSPFFFRVSHSCIYKYNKATADTPDEKLSNGIS